MKRLNLKNLSKSLFIFSLLAPVLSYGDILFMDLNNNPKEIEAAQRAATKRGENLIVFPKKTAAQKAAAASALRAIEQATQNERRACRGNNHSACNAALEASMEAHRLYTKASGDFRKDDLKKELAELTKNKVQLSSVIISGHDGNGHFNGSNGDLSDRDIKEAFDQNPALGSSVRSLLLWGCYTTNIGSLEKNWKKVLPNVTMVAGYDGSAPLGDKPANWGYLEDVLVKEKALTAAADEKAMRSIFSSIRGINIVASSICLNQDEVITPKGIKSIKKEYGNCKDLQSGKITEKFQCYEKAEPGCEDVPAVTSSGPLRELYNQIQSSSHCHEVVSTSMRIPSGDATIRLIFDKQVRKNFETQNKEGLEVLNNLIKEAKLPENLQFKDIDKLTRRQFIDQIKAVEKAIDQKSDPIKDEMGRIDDPTLLALKSALSPLQQLSYVGRSASCVPFEWVEPHARGGDHCGWKKQMQKAPDAGVFLAAKVQSNRSDEAAEMAVVGPSLIEARKKYAEATKRHRELSDRNAPLEERQKASEELFHSQEAVMNLQREAAPKIAQERVNYYAEKLKNVPDANQSLKSVYEDQLSRWQWKLKNPNTGGGMILGNGSPANMSTAPTGAMMGGGMLPPNVQRPESPPSPQPLPIPPQPR